jgi:hypothetical protein
VQPLVSLITVHGSFAAHVLAARLASEGIDVELRGALGGAYGLTVGDMARVDLFVPEDQIADARLVLLAGEIDAAMELPDGSAPSASRRAAWVWYCVAALVVIAVSAPLLRSLTS